MTWRLHRWVWQLEAPLYVGMAPAGSLNRCRPYVPARALWGALTAECARTEAGSGGSADYAGWGERFERELRLGYLFPAEEIRGRWRAWLPCWCRGRGLVWQREDLPEKEACPDRRFRMRLLHARAGIAMEPANDTAAEGSLRETECWNTTWRTEDGRADGPVGLVGYLFLRDGPDRPAPHRLPDTLFLGGDSRYGLGRVVRIGKAEPAQTLFGAEFKSMEDAPRVRTGVLRAHGRDGVLLGAYERVITWDRGRVRNPCGPLFWAPGSRCADPAGSEAFWRVEADGIWRYESPADRPHAAASESA